MKKNQDIPSHYYDEAAKRIQQVDGKPLLSLDPQFPFALTKFEYMNTLAQADYPHRHDYFEVLFICEGEGTHVIDFEPYPIQAPTFHFLSKGQIHFWQLNKPLKGYALIFPEEFIGFPTSNIIRTQDQTLFDHAEHTPCLSVNQEQAVMLGMLLEEMEREFHDDNARSITVLRAYLHILLTKLYRLYMADQPGERAEAASPLVHQFMQLVSEHYLAEHSVQDYAGRIGVSASHLRDTVKAVTGHAPGQLIRQKLALEAKRLLAHGDVTVAEIAYHLNFEDASYFGRFFKRETGMSPAAFRQKIREQYRIALE